MPTTTAASAFVTQFFTDRFDAAAAVDNRGRRSLSSHQIPTVNADSPLTEAFLLHLCHTHNLRLATDLFLFLLCEEAYVLRTAESNARAQTSPPLPLPYRSIDGGKDVGGPAAVGTRKRPREGEVAVGSVFASDSVFVSLMDALSAHILECRRVTAADAVTGLFPSLKTCVHMATGARQATALVSAPLPSIFFSTGCDGLDLLLSNGGGASVGRGARASCDETGPYWRRPGGFCSHQLTELSGEAGTGKTLIALQSALTHITRKLAADVLCRYFANVTASDSQEPESDGGCRPSRHPLAHYWPDVQALLSWLHGGEEGLFQPDETGRFTDIAQTLRLLPRRASAICCVYLVAEDVPAARLSSVAAGAVHRVYARLMAFAAPLLSADMCDGFARELRSELTLETVLNELKVRPFHSLEELLDLIQLSPERAVGRQGQLVDVLASLQRCRVPLAGDSALSAGGEPLTRASPSGLVVVDSIAAAAMQSASSSLSLSAPSHSGNAGGGMSRKAERNNGGGWGRTCMQGLLERVGIGLRQLAARYGLCVLVVNQVRSRVEPPPPHSADRDGAIACRPLIRLKHFRGFMTARSGGRNGSGRLLRPTLSTAAVSEASEAITSVPYGDGNGGRGGRDAEPVPALGIAWSAFPHTHVFLRREPGSALREMVLTSSPLAAPFSATFTITEDGLHESTDRF